MGKDRQFYRHVTSPLQSPVSPTEQQQQQLAQALTQQQKVTMPLINTRGMGKLPFQSAAELEHELAVKRAQKDCDVLARVRMISDEDKRNYHSMMISTDKESNLLAIASIDQKILELSQLVEMYNAGFNKKGT